MKSPERGGVLHSITILRAQGGQSQLGIILINILQIMLDYPPAMEYIKSIG